MLRMEENGLLDESLELKDEIGGNSSDSDIQILDDDDNDKNAGENESFVVDTSAQQEIGSNVGLDAECFNSSNIISHVYNGPDKNGERRSKGGRRSGQACFNCNSLEHPARDCPHPPNQRRISQNRNSFIKRREGSGRFHEDAEKEKEIVPGKISEKLREALGIDGRELPEWIYRMRKLGSIDGYPPGYRKIAIEESSFFEFHEGTTSSTNRKRKHDANNHLAISREKIIKYPGFNFDDGNYRDQRREKYPIPQFDDFINEQQTFLMQMDALKRKNEAMEETQIKKRKTDEGNSTEVNLIEDEEELDVLIVNTRKSSGSIEDGEIRENAGQIVEEEETTNITIRKKKKKKSKSKKTETNGTQSSTSKNNSATNVQAEMENNKNEKINEEENKSEKLNEDDKNEELIEEEATIPIMETSIPLIEDEDLPSSSQQNGNNDDMKPSLDSFAQGIQPFQHQAPGTSHGFIKRLHEIIKKTRKN